MKTKVAVGVSIPIELIRTIDSARGDVPRSRFIVKVLEGTIKRGGQD